MELFVKEKMEIKDVKPFINNAKEHPDKQIDKLAGVIRQIGWRQPVEVNSNGVIVVGHGRWMVWQKYKDSLPPIWIIDDKGNSIHGKHDERPLSEEQERMWRLADNQLNLMTGIDMDLALPELKLMSPEMFDLTGFDKDLLIESNEKDDVIPENAPPVAKLGDIWQLGRHRVMCGDSTKREDVEKLMDGKKADMVFTDPPYGVSYQDKAENILGRKDRAVIQNDGLGKDALRQIVFPAFQGIAENLKNGGVYYVCSPQGGELGLMMMMMIEAGIECRHMIIWAKDRAVFSMGRLDYDYQHEPILYGWRGSHKHIGNGQFKTSVWSIPNPRASKLHPTMKPVEIMQNAILNSSKEDDIVLDLFLGSGSTLIACEKTNRICFGMEIDEKYCDVIIKRWEDFTGNKATKIA